VLAKAWLTKRLAATSQCPAWKIAATRQLARRLNRSDYWREPTPRSTDLSGPARMTRGANTSPTCYRREDIPNQADVGHARQCCESVLDLPIERRSKDDNHALGVE
jgi:hypothetical protein